MRMLLLPLLVSFVVVTQPPRRVVLFFWSATFQTNLIGWIGMHPKSPPFFQMAGVCYLVTVAVVWWVALGGKEDNVPEAMFNGIIHYWTTILVVFDCIKYPRPDWPAVYWLLPFPVAYILQMPIMNAWAGWRVYPFSDVDLAVVFFLFAAVVGLVNLFYTSGNYIVSILWSRYPVFMFLVIFVLWLLFQPFEVFFNFMVYSAAPILGLVVYQLFRSVSGR